MFKVFLAATVMVGGLALGAPAIADETDGAALPTCSATVTDHCMQRASHMASHHHAATHHRYSRKHHRK